MKTLRVPALILTFAALHGLSAAAAAPPEEPALPLRLRAYMRIIRVKTDARTVATTRAIADLLGMSSKARSPDAAEPTTSGMVSIAIERFSGADEVEALGEVLGARGMKALIEALNERSLGEVHLNNELRMPIVIASTWSVGSIRNIRLALSRRLVRVDAANPSTQLDPVIDILDLSLPEGETYGSGTLVTAREVEFEDGRIAPVVIADDSVPLPISHVERPPPRRR